MNVPYVQSLVFGFALAYAGSAYPQASPTLLCDSGKRIDRGAVALFYVDKINGKGSFLDTTQAASGKDPSVAGWRMMITTRSRKLEGPSRLRLRVGYASAWSSPGLTVKGEVDFNPEPGHVYRVAGTLGQAYSAVWVEDALGNRVTDIVESSGKESAQAEVALAAAIAAAVPHDGSDPQARFLRMDEGECEAIILARFGEPDGRRKEGRAMGNRFEVMEYAGIGEAWMKYQTLQRVIPDSSSPTYLTAEGIRHALAEAGHDSLRVTAAGYARARITDPALLDEMADFVWANHLTKDRSIADAAAHLCHALGGSRNPRYRNLMERVANEAASSGLKRHARRNLELLTGHTDMPYELPK